MGLRLDITIKKLVAGNSFTIATLGSVGTYQTDIIASTLIPTSTQVQATDDFIPSTDILKESIDRVSIAISRIPKVVSVTSNETVISITFVDAVTDVTFSETDTANIRGVQKILDNGTVTTFNTPFVTNITVTSVNHTLPAFGFPVLTNPFGNMGDLLETTILFTASDVFNICNFYYGWVDNDTTIYPNPNNFQIDVGNFEDIRTGAFQKFTGDTTTFNAVAPLQGNKVLSVVLTNLGGNDYSLVINHYVPIFPQDLSNNSPEQITTSLKMVFQIDLLQDLINTDQLESTSKQNLSAFLGLGNVGYLNEVYRTGQQFYKLNSINWNNPSNQLNAGADVEGTIVIEKLNGNFSALFNGIINYSKVTDAFDEELTQLENLKLNNLLFSFDGTPSNGSVFDNVSVSFSGNLATITFTVLATTIQDNYFLWLNVHDGVTTYANQNILVQFGTVASLADESVVDFGTYPSSPRAEYNYSLHYLDDVTESFNEIKSYVDDFIISRFLINNSDIANNELVSFTIRLKEGNNILESYQINADDLTNGTYTIERNFNLLPNDVRKNILVVNDFVGNYGFIYPFQILQEWVGLDIVQETISVFNQTNAIGVVQFSNNWLSPVFELGNYDITKNDILEPQIVAPPSKIQYFDETGTTEVGKILKNEVTLVVATFEEDNLNDFEADPISPFTYVDNVFVDNYLCGYFGLNTDSNSQGNYYRFHNMRDNEQSPFVSIQAGYFAQLERLDIDTAKLTAKIDYDLVKEYFGEDFECLKVTARIDKMQDAALPPVQCIIVFQTDADNLTTVTALASVGANNTWKYKGLIVALGDSINQVIGTADGTTQDVEYFTDDCSTITTVEANGNEWVGVVDFSSLSNINSIELTQNRMTSITFPTGNINSITNLDLTRSDFVVVDLTGINIGGSLKAAAITQISPIEPLNSLILPLNNNNVWNFFQIINSSITSLDFSQQNNLGGSLRLLSNSLLVTLTLGSSNETFSTISIFGNSALGGNLDLSGYPNVLNINIDDNNLDSVTFANATSLMNGINGDNNNFTALDFTPLGNNFSGVIKFEDNNINSLTFPVNNQSITRLDFSRNNLSVIDVSMLTGLQGIIHFDNNSFTAQSDFNFGTITNVITNFKIDQNNIAGVWDFTTFMNVNTLSTVIDLRQNSITEIIYQSTNLNISFNYGANNNINTILDLSPLPNSSGILDFQNNSIPSVILPTSSNVFTQLRFNINNIVNFDVTPLTGPNNNINPLRLNNNDMTTVSMDDLIVDLDNKGWINGNLFLDSQSTAQQPTIGAAAYISLLSKGWSITI